MWERFVLMIGRPEALLVTGVLLAVSAAGNKLLSGPDVLVGTFGILATGCFAAAITIAAIQNERGQTR